MTPVSTQQSQVTLQHHLESIAKEDVDAVLADYLETSVLYTPNGPVRGLGELRAFFTGFFKNMPGFADGFEMLRQDIEAEAVYILWKSPKYTPLGTDTFIIRDGKILIQTFAAYLPS